MEPDGLIKTNQGLPINSCKISIKDMMITLPTLFIILNRKVEAFYWLERCIIICKKY